MDSDFQGCPRVVTILIVDDSEPARRAMADSFCRDSYRVLESKALATGIRRAAKYKPDCVLLDLDLPDCSGIKTLQHFMEAIPDSTIVVMTDDSSIGKRCVQDGAQDFIEKPFSQSQLVERVELAMARSAVRPYSIVFRNACQRVLETLEEKGRHDSDEAMRSSRPNASAITTLVAV